MKVKVETDYVSGVKMKKSLITLFLIATFYLTAATSLADHPPPPKSLAERVNLATHVFIGKAKGMRAVKVVRGKIQRVRPEPMHTGTASGVSVELDVEVQEAMFPTSWKPPRTVKVYFGGGIFSIKEMRKGFLANRYVYLTRINSLNGKTIFGASYPWHLVESLDKRGEIMAVLEKRVTR